MIALQTSAGDMFGSGTPEKITETRSEVWKKQILD